MEKEGSRIEQISSSEKEKPEPSASIRLEFFRHDDKEKETTAGPRPGDQEVRLTKKGREQATQAGKEKNTHPETAIAYGSSRKRSLESSLRQMLSSQEDITEDMSLEDIEAYIKDNLKSGIDSRKHIVSPLLDFDTEGTKEFNEILYKHYLKDKDLINFLYTESDDLVKKFKDTKSTSYTRLAGNVAELVAKYINILPRWQNIVSKADDKFSEFNNQMERYFGSHQGVLESFLLKVIEKTDGKKAAKEFMAKLPDKNGFDLSEGFSIYISSEKDNLKVVFKHKGQEWKVSPEVILDIIKEKDNLEEELNNISKKS